MTSPLAVLLIIGSAVVGPIEAQPKFSDVCVGVQSNGGTHGSCLATLESLPELCERAMREVGAAKWYRYSKNSKYPNGLITYELAKDLPAGTPPPEVKWTLPQTAYEKIEQTAMAKYFQTQPGFSPEFSFGTTYWNGPEVRCIPVPTGYKR